MAHRKLFGAFFLILLLVCAVLFAVPSVAEGSPDLASYYIFVRSGNESEFSSGMLPDLLSAFSFLHPDYVNVTLHVYKVSEFNNGSMTNCPELYNGAAGSADDFLRISSTLSELDSADQSVAGVPADQIMECAKTENAKVVFVGYFNSDGVAALTEKWIPLIGSLQYAVMNSNSNQINAVPRSIHYRDDLPGMTMDLYRTLCTGAYDQEIETKSETSNELSGSISVDVREIRILASPNTYYGPGSYYKNGNITLIEILPEYEQYKLELEDNGAAKKIYTSTVYQPYHFASAVIEEQKEKYSMSDVITVKVGVESRKGQSFFTFVPDEWDVKLVMTPKDKESVPVDMTWTENAFSYVIPMRDKSGSYNLRVEASTRTKSWIKLTEDIGEIRVKNDPPFMVEGAETSRDVVIWADDPLQNENETTISLRERFADDGPAEDIGFRLKKSVSWAKIQDNMLVIDPAQMSGEVSETLEIEAYDAAELSSTGSFSVSVKNYSVSSNMDGTAAELHITGADDGLFYRDTPVKTEVIASFPESLKLYLDFLAEKGTLDQFLELFKAAVIIDGNEFPVVGTRMEDDGVQGLRYEYLDEQVRTSGEHTVSFSMAIQEADGDRSVAEAEENIYVEDRTPVINESLIDTFAEKEIPGPLILNKNLPVEKSEISVNIGELVETEINDIITVEVYGDGDGMSLYRDEDNTRYWFADQMQENWEKVNKITWDTNEEAPVLIMRSSKHGKWNANIRVIDDGSNEAEASPLSITVNNRFHDEDLLTTIALSAAGLLLLLILVIIIHRIRKPAYGEQDILQVSLGGYSSDIPLQTWKKKGMTLREVLIYSAVPVIGELPAKALNTVKLTSGGKKRRLVIRNAKKAGLSVNLDGALQGSNKIELESSYNQADIILNGAETISLRMLDE